MHNGGGGSSGKQTAAEIKCMMGKRATHDTEVAILKNIYNLSLQCSRNAEQTGRNKH